MKILQAHNYYQQRGGEDAVVEAEKQLLQQHGHQVATFNRHNEAINSPFRKIQSCLHTHHNKASALAFEQTLVLEKPDIVHCHNLFPIISPSIYDICQKHCTPVVQTLHNFRMQCASGFLFRNGQICENCLTKKSTRDAIRYRCYRGSLIGSITLAHYIAYHQKHKTWQNKVNQFIALTEFAKTKFLQMGINDHQISIKPNFVDAIEQAPTPISDRSIDILYIGRLSHEKGIATLLQAAKQTQKIVTIIGEGPIHIDPNQNNIRALGKMSLTQILEKLSQAKMLVLPSIWYENFPRVIVEALSCGTPVIASKIGSLAEIIQHEHNGMLFKANDHDMLANTLNMLLQDNPKLQALSDQAYQTYHTHYTPEENYRQLMVIYKAVLEVSHKPDPLASAS